MKVRKWLKDQIIKKAPKGFIESAFRYYLEHLYKLKGRFRFALVPDEYIGRLILLNGSYESEITSFIEKKADILFARKSIFWDIGANYGVYSLELNNIFEKIYAFEPNPTMCHLIRANASLNGISNIEVKPFRLGMDDCKLPFYVSQTNLGESSTIKRDLVTEPQQIFQIDIKRVIFWIKRQGHKLTLLKLMWKSRN